MARVSFWKRPGSYAEIYPITSIATNVGSLQLISNVRSNAVMSTIFSESTKQLLEASRKLRDESRVLQAEAKASKQKTDEIMARSNTLINHSKSLQHASERNEQINLWLRGRSSARRHQKKR